MRERYPHTWKYLKRFEPILRERAAFKRYFTREDRGGKVIETGPFYSMFDVGDYTFAPWKVVWTRIAQISAAVVNEQDGKPVIPQETITLVSCESEREAHYITALVNSAPFQFAASSYSQEGGKSMGSMHVLEHIRIPKYDPADQVHQALAQASKEAHEAAARGNEARLREIEERINTLAAQLWGLTHKEVIIIHSDLGALVGGKG